MKRIKRIFYVLMLLAMPSAALTIEHAKSFIEDLGRRAITTLTSGHKSDEELGKEFLSLLDEGFDVPAIGKFTLGRYWRQATPEQQADFLKVFRNRLKQSYANRFREYKGVKFVVKDGRKEADGGVVITSTIQKPGGPVVHVTWKVYDNKAGVPKIYDVTVDGISMSVSLRDDYAAAISNNGGDVGKFISSMKK
jgi:phospholipid transport system substrate-binding protein